MEYAIIPDKGSSNMKPVDCEMVDRHRAGFEMYGDVDLFECPIEKCPYGNLTDSGICQTQGKISSIEKGLIANVTE